MPSLRSGIRDGFTNGQMVKQGLPVRELVAQSCCFSFSPTESEWKSFQLDRVTLPKGETRWHVLKSHNIILSHVCA